MRIVPPWSPLIRINLKTSGLHQKRTFHTIVFELLLLFILIQLNSNMYVFFYPFCLCVHTETYVNGFSESYKIEKPIPLLLPSILNRRNESRRFQIYPLHRTFKICPFSVTKRQNGFEKTRFQFIQKNRHCSPDNCISLNFSRYWTEGRVDRMYTCTYFRKGSI